MEIVSFVNLLADVSFLVFAGIFVAAMGLFLFDRRPARKESVESIDQRERRAA